MGPVFALSQHGVELGTRHGDRLIRVGRGSLRLSVAVLDALLELSRGLSERAGQLGQAGRAEQDQDDHQDDDEFGRSEVHCASRLQAAATSSTSSALTTEKGTGPTLTTSAETSSASHP